MRAVMGSYSTPVSRVASRRASGQQGEEQARSHAWLQDVPAVEPEVLGGAPEAADHRLGGVVGVLRCPLQGGVFRRRRDGREGATDFLPAGPETVRAGQREAILGQVRGPEADEAQELRLLL